MPFLISFWKIHKSLRKSLKRILAAKAQVAAKRAREVIRKKSGLERFLTCLVNWQTVLQTTTWNRTLHRRRDSAGGSAKSGRNREFQGILPTVVKFWTLKSKYGQDSCQWRVRSLFTAMGTGLVLNLMSQKRVIKKLVIWLMPMSMAHISEPSVDLDLLSKPVLGKRICLYCATTNLWGQSR